MGKFLTGPVRIQQTCRKRVWKLLDNELFLDDDGSICLAPRNFYTDNYTIPMWVSIIAGSPVDWATAPSHIHDLACDTRSVLKVKLTEEELKALGYLRYSSKNEMWVCEDIPINFLYTEKVNKLQANNLLYRCMKACDIPTLNRTIIRLGVCFNIGWYIDYWLGRVFDLDLEQVYNEKYWNEKVWY